MTAPLPLLTLAFCTGIALSDRVGLPFWTLYALAWALAGAAFFIRRRRAFIALVCAVAFLCGGAALRNAERLPACYIWRYLQPGPQATCIIRGFVSDEPRRDGDTLFFHVSTEQIQIGGINRRCCGDIAVAAKISQGLAYGQAVLLQGDFRTILHVRTPADIMIIPRWEGSRWRGVALWMKHQAEVIIYRYASPASGAIIDAMLLGERKGIPKTIIDAMMKSGTIHILVVSGFNVGLVASVIMLVLKLARIGRRAKVVLVMPALALYCLATGGSAPVVRATVMALVMMSAYLFQRDADVLISLSLAACAILLCNPGQLFDIGFQLSFASVFAIIWLYPKLRQRLSLDAVEPAPLRWCLDNFLVSVSAWLGTLGFIAYYFKFFSPVTVLANIVIVPLASLVTLCGISLVAAGGFCPVLAPYISRTCEFLILLMVGANNFFLSLPGAYFRLDNI